MKKLMSLGIMLGALIYGYPDQSSRVLNSFKTKAMPFGKTNKDYREELSYKKAELAIYQKAIDDITVDMERIVNTAPICPTTGRRAITTFTKDARVELQAKCDVLENEILLLEDKLKD